MKKQFFGAILLSAALAVGTAMPAFAEVDPTLDGSMEDSSYEISDAMTGTAKTNVHIQTSITQINVSVPLKVVLGAQAAGGELKTPTANLYGISSTTPSKVYVQQAVVTEANATQWALPTTAQSTAPTNCQAGSVATSTITYGNIWVTMTGLNGTTATPLKKGTTTYTLANAATNPASQSGVLQECTDASNPSKMPINFAGSTSILNTVNDATAEAFNITYTVSVQPNTATAFRTA